jgi:subtilisin family serine protease
MAALRKHAPSEEASLALKMVGLDYPMALSEGSADLKIGLLDGSVDADSPDLAGSRITRLDADPCGPASSASGHATLIAKMLVARRDASPPGICPGCTLLVRPIFSQSHRSRGLPGAAPQDVAEAILDATAAGARVINLSAATAMASTRTYLGLRHALDYAVQHGVLLVAAAGNQASLGSSELTRHHGCVPVVAYDLRGHPTAMSNLGRSAGQRGLGAPGNVVMPDVDGKPMLQSGTSFAAARVTGAIALLWSLFPSASASSIRMALRTDRGRSVTPPLMDVRAAYQRLQVGLAARPSYGQLVPRT